MADKNIEKGLKKERKYILPLNKVFSNKKMLAIICVVISILFILLCNYLFNCILQIGNLANDIGNLQTYFSIKNMFVFNIEQHYLFYVVLAIVVAILNVRFIFLVNTNIKDQNVNQKGGDRWTTIEEIQEEYPSMKEKGSPIQKGGLPVCQYKGIIYFDDSPVNNLVYGMTRAGKGEGFVILMIWLYCNAKNKASLIVNDAKVELVTMSYAQLEKNGYIPLVINLNKPTDGIGFNPIDLVIRYWKEKKYSDAETLALSIAETIYHSSRLEGEAKFWASTASGVFSALVIAQVCDCLEADKKINAANKIEWRRRQKAFEKLSEQEKEKVRVDFEKFSDDEKLAMPYIPADKKYVPTHENEDKINLYSVCRQFMDLASVSIGKTGKTALDVFFSERPENDRAKMKFFSTQIAPDRTTASIYASFFDALTIFTFEDVAKMTAKSTFDIYDIGFGEKPYAIFLLTPDWDVSKHFLVNIFLDQVYFALSSRAAEMPDKKCSRDVMHILDEFGNMIPLSNIQNRVSAGAGKGILHTFFVQSFGQLEPYKENAKTIKDNCSNQVYILSGDNKTREEFSNDVGKETVTNVHRNGRYLSLDKTFMEVYEERPLITANELKNLAEGENVIIRYTKRRDMNRNKIRPNPILNTGETAFKYRYEFLNDEFPNNIPFSSLKLHNRVKQNFDLSDISVDTNKLFQEKLEKINADSNGGKSELQETEKIISSLEQADIILKQLEKFVEDRNCKNMTVGEAVTEIENACNLGFLTQAESNSLIDLMLETDNRERR